MNKYEKAVKVFFMSIQHSKLFQLRKNYLFQTFIPKYKNIDDNPH